MPEDIVVPKAPHMPAEGVRKLTELLRGSSCFLEYGSGGSTYLASSLNVPTIVSVDSDRDYLDAVKHLVQSTETTSLLHVAYCDIGPTGAWGRPIDNSGSRRWPHYAVGVWGALKKRNLMPDLVLIDGRFRVACTLASIISMPAGSTIMIDDYVGRENAYGIVTRYAVLKEIVGVGAIFSTPERIKYPEITFDLAKYSVIPD